MKISVWPHNTANTNKKRKKKAEIMNEKNLARQITCLGEVNGGYKNGIINIYVNM